MLIGWVVNLGLNITFLVISLHGNLSCSKLFLLLGTPAMLGVPFVQGIFFSIVLLVSYIGKVYMFCGFIWLVGCFIFALTNYNTMTTTNKFSCESWLNMNATYKGYKVQINTDFSYVYIEHDSFESGSWFFQGQEADEVINEINYIYNTVSNISAIEAAIRWANNMLH